MIVKKRIKIKDLFKALNMGDEEKTWDAPKSLKVLSENNKYEKVLGLYKTNKRDVVTSFFLDEQNMTTKHVTGVPKHRVKSGNEWVYLKDLTIDNMQVDIKDSNGTFKKTIEEKEKQNCYDLQVDNTHSFYTNDILSHNTEMFLTILKLTQLKTLILFARVQLANDTKKRATDAGLDTGIVQGKNIDENHQIVMSTVQSSHKLQQDYDLVIVDECFPGNTQILTENGNKDIKKLVQERSTEKVWSYNIETSKYELKAISNWYKKQTEELIQIRTDKRYKILCTPNHPIYIEGFTTKRADELTINDKIIIKPRDIRGNGLCPALSDKQKSIVLGMVLGDSNLQDTGNNARLRTNHSKKQYKYLMYKTELLENIFTTIKPNCGKSGYGADVCGNRSKASYELKELYNKMYINKEKTVKNVIYNIDEISLAFWIMDDGSYGSHTDKTGHYGIATHSFSYEDNVLIASVLKNKWNIDSKIRLDKRCNKYYIVFDTKSSTIISNLIYKYVHPSMDYKLPKILKNKHEFILDNNKEYGYLPITSIKKINKKETVYNITVDNNHNYFIAPGYLVGNCHRSSAAQYQELLAKDFKYRLGFSATPLVKDKYKSTQVKMWLGDVLMEIPAEKLINDKQLSKPTIHILPINRPIGLENKLWQSAERNGIVKNSYRNKVIAELVKQLKNQQVLVLVKAIEQGDTLNSLIPDSIFLSGQHKNKDRDEVLNRFRDGEQFTLIASTIFDEGIDIKNVNSVIVCAGGASYVKTLQRLGRGTRILKDKDGKIIKDSVDIFDFLDETNPILERHSNTRIKHYQKEGFNDIKYWKDETIKTIYNNRKQ